GAGRRALVVPLCGAALAGVLCLAPGPTAVWRHSGIGAGRTAEVGTTENSLHDWEEGRRRILGWEAEGVESSVAVVRDNGTSFVINGKADGNAWADAPT